MFHKTSSYFIKLHNTSYTFTIFHKTSWNFITLHMQNDCLILHEFSDSVPETSKVFLGPPATQSRSKTLWNVYMQLDCCNVVDVYVKEQLGSLFLSKIITSEKYTHHLTVDYLVPPRQETQVHPKNWFVFYR